MSVGVLEDYKLRDLRASHTLGIVVYYESIKRELKQQPGKTMTPFWNNNQAPRGRVRQIISNAKRFQRGDWKYLWETALRLARRETDSNVNHKHNRVKRDTSSIKSRVVYTEHCARWGALSNANQAVTSNALPNADPINTNLLRAKHLDPAHSTILNYILLFVNVLSSPT